MTTTAALRALSGMRAFTDEELTLLVGVAKPRAVARGETLWREGEVGRSCAVLVRGSLEVVRDRGGVARRVATLEPGALVGQLALVDRGPRGATVRAASDVELLELTRDDFERLLRAASPLALRFQRQVALAGIRQLRGVIRRLAELPRAAPDPARRDDALSAIRAATAEWGISDEELDAVEVVQMATRSDAPRRR